VTDLLARGSLLIFGYLTALSGAFEGGVPDLLRETQEGRI
jgi:hypothetical protein